MEYPVNIGAVSLPISVPIAVAERLLSPRDRVALLAAGSGLDSVMLGLEW